MTKQRHELNVGRIVKKLRYRGTFVDYWTCIHVVTGMLLGTVLARTEMPFFYGFGFAVFAFILWELVEPSLHQFIGRRFPEKLSNQIADVLFGIMGYLIGYTLLSPHAMLEAVFWILDRLSG